MYGTIIHRIFTVSYIILQVNNSIQLDSITSSPSLFHLGTVLGRNEYSYRYELKVVSKAGPQYR